MVQREKSQEPSGSANQGKILPLLSDGLLERLVGFLQSAVRAL